MLSLVLVHHPVLVDINRAFYVMHRKNRLDYVIESVVGPADLPMRSVRTYPTHLLVHSIGEGWSLVRGNSVFDLAPIARSLSGALACQALAAVHQPLHDESAIGFYEQGREIFRIAHRHGHTAVNGDPGDRVAVDTIQADSRFGLQQMAGLVKSLGIPLDLRDDLDRLPATFSIASA